MTSDRYVSTQAIRRAVRGCEIAVLAALGITWQGGAQHIACPYPDHDDQNPSWRWDERKARDYCTCIERSHSIFDVVMRIEGLDFEAAKLRVAEILGRHDLIKVRDGERHQAMDAASLLRPPAEQRDDELVRGYLAWRLDVPPEQVAMPATPVAGWRCLAYYDPPAGRGGKPKLVGLHPCAVFGTLAPDGRRHAHRTYVAADGQGKAELGVDARGRPRDPKKSARLKEGRSAAGCVVLWGDPTRAPHILLCEGIETAAALALARQGEIEAGEMIVAAALSTSGMQAFVPWPATRTITVAADRDEDKPPDDRGYRAGERAARAFALAHHERVEIKIALPGDPGEDVDWLDILRRDGVHAVRAGLAGAQRFAPTQQEIDDARQRAESASALAEIERTYPLPALESMTLDYRHTRSGRIMVHKYAGKNKEGEDVWLPVATPFGVPARVRHADQANAYGLRMTVQDMDGRPRVVEFDRATLPRMAAAEIRAQLFAAGLRTEADGEMVAVQALKAADPSCEIILVSRSGWHRIPELSDPAFVTPEGDVLGAPAGCMLELAAAARVPGSTRMGSLDGWRAAVAAAVLATNCPHWVLGAAAGFAGSILALVGFDTCGINLSGLSTSGKTLAQKLAVSAWTTPRIGVGLLQSLRTTENAIESLAQASTGTVLALDEMAHVDGQTLGRLIYSIASGLGKARLTSQATQQQRYSWATFGILSGECSLEEKVRGDGGHWLAGMAVRFPDVDVTDVNRSVPRVTLDAMAAIDDHCGHAGPAFVQGLVAHAYHRNPEPLRQIVLKATHKIAGEKADSAGIRAATPFGLLLTAGELAKAFRLLPAETRVTDAVQWGWQRFGASSDALALDPAALAVSNLRVWIAERWGVTIKPIEPAFDSFGNALVNNRECVGWYDDDAVYLPTRRTREAAGSALKEQEIARILDERGLLAVHERGRLTVRYVPKVGHLQCYALRRAAFGRSDAEQEPEFTVYQGGRQ
jgi:Domain of unknown function (DUF927)/Toprim domain